ncbi:phosphomannomutase/phosphoglucomutase [Defluviimonas sp. WL0075]|uniref:Phosphomannomutase/phosphoglucomutase n=1 Tax=Albidovulum sediminicola TaxID=2984331 RepID=A0ABT2Z4U8_9RHOB|nr:phosphomannomutase/phosphoglucomutase [Defluviimonas sp. WL0075]MCV2866050.1 phosphomannomutase/phosphoglucomutase [Defluviimonas sp. WL0075]
MTRQPLTAVRPNTWEFLRDAMIYPAGFREYDARWKYPDQINLPGVTALGLGLGTQIMRRGLEPTIAVGNDYRDYSLAIKQALTLGLMRAGIRVRDIGPALSPMTYFAQGYLRTSAVAMVTASHNPNGWTGVKMGLDYPVTHGPDEMSELRDMVLGGTWEEAPGGSYEFVPGVEEAYMDDLVGDFRLTRPLKVVCACGNGTAGRFAPRLLERIGAEVVPLHTELDYTFPNYNPNPEDMHMLHDMAGVVRETRADLALGFDGDGDRCGVVDDEGDEIFADKVGLILARKYAAEYLGAKFVVDVKSTGLYSADPVLKDLGATTEYWKTGHSYMKRRVRETGALAGFEKSGHYFIAPPVGRGFDCGMRVAVEICKLMEANHAAKFSDLKKALPTSFITPTMSPHCPDEEKYTVLERIIARLQEVQSQSGGLAGHRISGIITVNGARVMLDHGGFALVRASSNTPNLVVVCESPESAEDMKAIFRDLDTIIREQPQVGAYDQTL